MKRAAYAVFCLLCALSLSLLTVGCTPTAEPEPIAQPAPLRYQAEMALDTSLRVWSCRVEIHYASPCEELREVTVWSTMDVSCTMEGQDLPCRRQSVYTLVTLPRVYASGETMVLELNYTLPLATNAPTCDFVPMVCRYDEEYCTPAPLEFAPYRQVEQGEIDLTVRLPKTYVALLSGDALEQTFDDETQTLQCRLDTTQNAVLTTSPYYVRRTAQVGDVQWEYYAMDVGDIAWQTIVQVARSATEAWGSPPTRKVVIVRCKGTAQGANLTCVDEGSILSLTRAVVNAWVRTPHSAEAWIEPGLRQYALYRYLEDYDDERADAMLAQAKDALLCYQVRHGTTGEDARMDKDVHDCDEEAYHALMEHKALLLWCSLAEVAGSGVRQAAQALAVCDKSLTTADVADALRTHTRRDYGYYLEAWIGGNVTYCHCPWGNGST